MNGAKIQTLEEYLQDSRTQENPTQESGNKGTIENPYTFDDPIAITPNWSDDNPWLKSGYIENYTIKASDTAEFQPKKVPSTEPRPTQPHSSELSEKYLNDIIAKFMNEQSSGSGKITTSDLNASMYYAGSINSSRPTSEADYNEVRRGKPKTGQGIREQIVNDIPVHAPNYIEDKPAKRTLEQVKTLIKDSETFIGFTRSYITYILENIKEEDVDVNLFDINMSFHKIPSRKIQPFIENTYRNIQERIISAPIFEIYNKYKDVIFIAGEKFVVDNSDYSVLVRYLDNNKVGNEMAQSLYKACREKNNTERKRVLFTKMMLFFLEKNEKIENE